MSQLQNQNHLSYDLICRIKDPLHWNETNRSLMVKAVRDVCSFHNENSLTIKKLYQKYHFSPEMIQSENDFNVIPVIGVTAMKHFLLLSRSPEKAVLKLTSSGTGGQKTQIWFDKESLERVQLMLDSYFLQEGMSGQELTNYLIFSYDPEDAKDLGIAYTEKNQLRFAPPKGVHYVLKKKDGEWFYDRELCLNILRKYVQEGLPIRLLGLPSFMYDLLLFMKDERLVVPKGSLMITGGGWKAAEDKAITREAFRSLCHQILGIPQEQMRDAFGMAEHSAPYFECRHHHFHVPAYNHLIIRDPETFAVMPKGEMGLLELITPFNTMMPTVALLSTDWATIDRDPCSCGWKSPTFKIIGRAGTSKHKGCALHAEDLVK